MRGASVVIAPQPHADAREPAHEITVELPGAAAVPGDEARLEQAFEATYTGLFGRTPPNVPIEVVSWRVRLAGPRPDLRLSVPAAASDASHALKGERRAYFPELDGYHSTPVYDRHKLGAGAELRGPAIVEERESTVVIGPRGATRVDDVLNLIVELEPNCLFWNQEGNPQRRSANPSPIRLSATPSTSNARPGKAVIHQACSRNWRPAAIMAPHSGVGGCGPRPR